MAKEKTDKSNIYLKVGVAVFFIALIIVVLFVLFKGNTSGQNYVTSTIQHPKRTILLTAVDLSAHDLSSGQTYSFGTDKGFNYTNYTKGYYTFSFSCSGGGTESVDSFQLSPSSFVVTNVTPTLPFMLRCNNQSVSFTIRFEIPNETYVGVLTVTETYNDYTG